MRTMLLALLIGAAASAQEPRVYYGSKDDPSAALVRARAVFAHIPEYQEITRHGYTSRDPEYWILLEQANRRFHSALHRVARREELGVIFERDGAPKEVPTDVTDEVIAALPRQ